MDNFDLAKSLTINAAVCVTHHMHCFANNLLRFYDFRKNEKNVLLFNKNLFNSTIFFSIFHTKIEKPKIFSK